MESIPTVVWLATPIAMAVLALLAWQLARRLARNDRAFRPAGTRASRTEAASCYAAILAHLAPLPYEISVSRHLGFLEDHLAPLAKELRSKPPPFCNWGEVLEEVAQQLSGLRQVSGAIRPLLENRTLRVQPHFERRLTKLLAKTRDCAAREDELGCAEAVKEAHAILEQWRWLCEAWCELRLSAASCIRPADEVTRIMSTHWGWLRHGVENFLEDRQSGEQYAWYPWGVFSKPDQLKKLTEWVVAELTEFAWPYDLICEMSGTGAHLATLLSIETKRPLIAIDSKSFGFLPHEPWSGSGVLLVDSNVQTGFHLQRAIEEVEAAGATVAGVVCICLNDALPRVLKKHEIVNEILARGRLISLFQMSDLYRAWRESRWSVQSVRVTTPRPEHSDDPISG
jgi:orotate phosphoribosyltransferase